MNTKLSEAINSVAGRFTSLVLSAGKCKSKGGKKTKGYCARITSVGAKMLSFEDVNTGRVHRAPLNSVISLRSGSTTVYAA